MVTVDLRCGDALTLLAELEAGSVDAVVTDPPYGISHSSNHGASWTGTQISGDYDISLRDELIAWAESNKLPWLAFGSWRQAIPKDTRVKLIWDKGPASGMGDLSLPFKLSYEEIYIGGMGWGGKRDEGVIKGHIVLSWESRGRAHPHEKPVSLMCYLIGKLPGARVIFDPFMGSGTTGIACVELKRNFIGFEIEPNYFEIAKRRIEQEQSKFSLL